MHDEGEKKIQMNKSTCYRIISGQNIMFKYQTSHKIYVSFKITKIFDLYKYNKFLKLMFGHVLRLHPLNCNS